MAELTIIYWRDIPAQVIARQGRESAKVALSDRFQEAIDAAATRVGLIGTDDYLAQWRRVTRACGDDLQAEARTEADLLDEEFPDGILEGLIRTGGSFA